MLGAIASFVVSLKIGDSAHYIFISALDFIICATVVLLNLRTGLWSFLPTMQKVCSVMAATALIIATIPVIPKHLSVLLLAFSGISFYPTIATSWAGKSHEPRAAWGLWSLGLAITLVGVSMAYTNVWQLVLPSIAFLAHFAVYLTTFRPKTTAI